MRKIVAGWVFEKAIIIDRGKYSRDSSGKAEMDFGFIPSTLQQTRPKFPLTQPLPISPSLPRRGAAPSPPVSAAWLSPAAASQTYIWFWP
jgi:hypothetical protein